MRMTDRFIVEPGTRVDLARHDPADTAGIRTKRDARKRLKDNLDRLSELQYLLYAEGRRALLVVFQAMDAGGKDGAIRHVLGPINPQGCRVTSFKVPTEEELAHDFLWRVHKAVPRKSMIGVFNRSHYEDVLVVRVHNLVPRGVWSRRYAMINAFEKLLAAEGCHILKFFLHISKREQLDRFRDRLEEPDRHWKVNPKDFEERKLWPDYMAAYEDALSKCSTRHAPWFVIPSDRKWFRNLAVSEVLVEAMEGFSMAYPEPEFDLSKLKVE